MDKPEKNNVFVVVGRNNLLHWVGTVGVAKTRQGAKKIIAENIQNLDEHEIFEHPLKD